MGKRKRMKFKYNLRLIIFYHAFGRYVFFLNAIREANISRTKKKHTFFLIFAFYYIL